MNGPVQSEPASPRCPLCKRAASRDFAPFCSKSCKDRDLLQWLDDGYAMPGPPLDDPDWQAD
ncbi:MAG: DNA gyrase inhibitor YacG [Blastomonas sp.]